MDKTTDLIPSRTRAAPRSHPGEGITAAPSGNKHIDRIQAEIRKTREETIQTINELERRLSLSHFIERVREKTRQAAAGRTDAMAQDTSEISKRWGTALYDAIRSNPIPTMLVGGGLAWLIAIGMRREDGTSQTGFVERRRRIGIDETGTYGMGFIDRRGAGTSGAAGQAREKTAKKIGQVKDRILNKASEASDKAARWRYQVRARASQTGEQVRLKSQELGSSAIEYSRRAQESITRGGKGLVRSVESSPLLMVGLAMATGAVLGLIIPESYYEEEKFGPQRNEMLAHAREAGREKIEQAEAVVRKSLESAKESAKQEAERQGLISPEKDE
jgi:hypothetical protein